MLRASAAALALGFLAAPVMAGEFRSGTYSESGSSRSVRNVLSGVESIDSNRIFSNVITGNSQVETLSVSASADNARAFRQSYGFATGDISAQGSIGVGGSLDIEDQDSILGLGTDAFSATGAAALLAQASLDVDGRIGTGEEVGLDGSLDFSFQRGTQDIAFGLNESGETQYNMEQTYTENVVSDQHSASGGSVFSFN